MVDVVSILQITIGPKCECVLLLPLTAHEFMIWILKRMLMLNLCFLTAQNCVCFKTINNFSRCASVYVLSIISSVSFLSTIPYLYTRHTGLIHSLYVYKLYIYSLNTMEDIDQKILST